MTYFFYFFFVELLYQNYLVLKTKLGLVWGEARVYQSTWNKWINSYIGGGIAPTCGTPRHGPKHHMMKVWHVV